jgi:hypothetical protein
MHGHGSYKNELMRAMTCMIMDHGIFLDHHGLSITNLDEVISWGILGLKGVWFWNIHLEILQFAHQTEMKGTFCV